jgi:hypothetical protein
MTKERPHAGIAARGGERSARGGHGRRTRHLTPCAQRREVAVGRILSQVVVSDPRDQHDQPWNEHGHPPTPPLSDAEADESGEQQRHHHLRDAAAQIPPTCRSGIRGTDDIGREHDRRVILRDHERRADRPDGKAEQQKRLVIVRQPDSHHRQRAQHEQPCVSAPRPDTVAKKPDPRPDNQGDQDRSDGQIADLRLGKVKLLPDDRHQRREPEPSEKANEEGEPRHVERSHRGARKVGEPDAGGFVSQSHTRLPLCVSG